MKFQYLLAVFLIVLVVTDHCQAFFSLLPSLIGGLVSAIKGRRRRQLEARFEPKQRNFRKRELDFEKLFANMPDY
uniref:Imcroporin n=2 Tax=Isometrus maculatus TaxID=497827 RepID=NDB47_ISOMC|nr:RecName: Full=Imcroporin; AltName: Full=Non-disulfide-bridged peptide 4.7; Short=NDBP-4.7; Flags: Precursor [Isometrus maculatus]ACD11809.1 hypothetical protein [Isometrus maculatus]ACT78488.1 imcroporin [Isometrus maculatus]